MPWTGQRKKVGSTAKASMRDFASSLLNSLFSGNCGHRYCFTLARRTKVAVEVRRFFQINAASHGTMPTNAPCWREHALRRIIIPSQFGRPIP
jgi:hypothetical protein